MQNFAKLFLIVFVLSMISVPVVADETVFIADLSNKDNGGYPAGWAVSPQWGTGTGNVGIAPGPIIRMPASGWGTLDSQAIYTERTWSGRYIYTVEVQVQSNSDSNKIRIIFNYSSTTGNNFYYLEIGGGNNNDIANTVKVRKSVNGAQSDVTTGVSFPARDRYAKFEITYDNGYISVKGFRGDAETVLFNKVYDTTHISGYIGVGTDNAHGWFRNIRVETLPDLGKPETKKLTPTDDSQVDNVAPDTPKGGSNEMYTGKSMNGSHASLPGGTAMAYILMKFDLRNITDEILSAELFANIKTWYTGNGCFYALPDNWDETTVTFSNMPKFSENDLIGNFSLSSTSGNEIRRSLGKSLTDYIKTQHKGDGIASVMLYLPFTKGNDNGLLDNLVVYSKNNSNYERHPYLEIVTQAKPVRVNIPTLTHDTAGVVNKIQGGEITVSTLVEKIYNEENQFVPKSAVMFAGLYDGDDLINVAVSNIWKVTEDPGSETLSAKIEIPSDTSNLKLMTFVWDGVAKLRPVSNMFAFDDVGRVR